MMRGVGKRVRAGWPAGAVATGCLVLAGPAAGAQGGLPSCTSTHWVGSWAASPTSAGSGANLYGLPPYVSVADQSYRLVITPHRGGSEVRVRLSNRFGLTPTTFGRVTIALRGSGAAIQAGTLRPVTFGGRGSVTAPARADIVSDPVRIDFRTGQQLAVSIHVTGPAAGPTEHNGAVSTQYLTLPSAGDRTTSVGGEEFVQRATSWIYLSGLDVRAPANVGTVVALGDSITDGYDATTVGSVPAETGAIDRYIRWPDALQTRLDEAGRPIVAINQGISGGRLVRDQPNLLGQSAVSRLQKDVIEQPGVRSAIVVMGINDLGLSPPFATPQELIDGFTNITGRLKAKGIRVILGTIPPASGSVIDGVGNNPLSDSRRRETNAWILTQRISDGVATSPPPWTTRHGPAACAPSTAAATACTRASWATRSWRGRSTSPSSRSRRAPPSCSSPARPCAGGACGSA